MRSVVTKVVINAFSIWIATLVIPAVTVGGGSLGHGVLSLLIVGALFGLLNTFIKPVVRLFTLPLYLLTLGLISFVVNALMLKIVEWLSHALKLFPMTQHLITNRHVVLEGDTATGRSYYYNPLGRPDGKGGMQLLFFGGYYNDRFRRTADGWRIAERVEETAWVEGSLPGTPPQN